MNNVDLEKNSYCINNKNNLNFVIIKNIDKDTSIDINKYKTA